MSDNLKPRAYDIDNSNDMARLFRECAGYLQTCKRDITAPILKDGNSRWLR